MDVLAVTICGACFVVLSFRLCPQACTGFVRAFKTISYTEQFQHTCMYRQNSDGGHISAQCTAHRNKINHSYPTRKPKDLMPLFKISYFSIHVRPSIHPSINNIHPFIKQATQKPQTQKNTHTQCWLVEPPNNLSGNANKEPLFYPVNFSCKKQ